MSEVANTAMYDYWNGDGGHMWLGFQDRIDASLQRFGEQAISAADFSKGERVLDIGCGCGDTSMAIARLLGSAGHVHAIDISSLILEQARSRAGSISAGNVSFECVDAQCHPFESMAFDVVFSRFGVMFFEDPVVAFANLRQALKPGGRLAFICWQEVNNNAWVNLSLQAAAKFIRLPPPPEPQQPGAFSFADAYRVRRILGAAGFTGVSIQRFNAAFKVGEDLDEAVNFMLQIGPVRAALSEADIDDLTRSQISTELRRQLAAYDSGDGISLDAETWIVTANNTYA